MITATMTDEELRANAYRDLLEMRCKIQFAYERFYRCVRQGLKYKVSVHSVVENHLIHTRAHNTWHVQFSCDGYSSGERIIIMLFIYMPLLTERGKMDYLCIADPDKVLFERVTSHFIRRYRERYLDYNHIDLKGECPVVYFFRKNKIRRLTSYYLDNWTEEEKKEKCIYVSEQGLFISKLVNSVLTHITFMDHQNLTRYKARIYEEERVSQFLLSLEEFTDLRQRDAMFKRFFDDPNNVEVLKRRYSYLQGNNKTIYISALEKLEKLSYEIANSRSKMQKYSPDTDLRSLSLIGSVSSTSVHDITTIVHD